MDISPFSRIQLSRDFVLLSLVIFAMHSSLFSSSSSLDFDFLQEAFYDVICLL